MKRHQLEHILRASGAITDDLAISKLAACREKDLAFVRVMLESRLIDAGKVCELMKTLPDAVRAHVENTWLCVSNS